MEIWIGLFMKPTHYIEGGVLTHEFAKDRGVTYFHSILYLLIDHLTIISTYDNEEDNYDVTISHIKYKDSYNPSSTDQQLHLIL